MTVAKENGKGYAASPPAMRRPGAAEGHVLAKTVSLALLVCGWMIFFQPAESQEEKFIVGIAAATSAKPSPNPQVRAVTRGSYKFPLNGDVGDYTGTLYGTILSLKDVNSDSARMEVALTADDIDQKCRRNPHPWATISYCIKATRVLSGLDADSGIDLSIYTSASIDARSPFLLEQAIANCSKRELRVNGGNQYVNSFHLLFLQPGSTPRSTGVWLDNTGRRVYDNYSQQTRTNDIVLTYLGQLYPALCPAESHALIRSAGRYKLGGAYRLIICRSDGFTVVWEDIEDWDYWNTRVDILGGRYHNWRSSIDKNTPVDYIDFALSAKYDVLFQQICPNKG